MKVLQNVYQYKSDLFKLKVFYICWILIPDDCAQCVNLTTAESRWSTRCLASVMKANTTGNTHLRLATIWSRTSKENPLQSLLGYRIKVQTDTSIQIWRQQCICHHICGNVMNIIITLNNAILNPPFFS